MPSSRHQETAAARELRQRSTGIKTEKLDFVAGLEDQLRSKTLGQTLDELELIHRVTFCKAPQMTLRLPAEQRLINTEEFAGVGQHALVLLEFERSFRGGHRG